MTRLKPETVENLKQIAFEAMAILSGEDPPKVTIELRTGGRVLGSAYAPVAYLVIDRSATEEDPRKQLDVKMVFLGAARVGIAARDTIRRASDVLKETGVEPSTLLVFDRTE